MTIDVSMEIEQFAVEGSATPSEPTCVAPAAGGATGPERARPCVEVNIYDLVKEEETLAFASYVGDLHPGHARRLAEVSAELDRRWKQFG